MSKGRITRQELNPSLIQDIETKASKDEYGRVKIGSGINVEDGVISVGDMIAENVEVSDAGGYFEASNVEGALQELGQSVGVAKSSLIESANKLLDM